MTDFMMEQREEEVAEEEEYSGKADWRWLMLISILDIAADTPCIDQYFQDRATCTDQWAQSLC